MSYRGFEYHTTSPDFNGGEVGSSQFRVSTTSNKKYFKDFPLLNSFKLLLITAVFPQNRLDPRRCRTSDFVGRFL